MKFRVYSDLHLEKDVWAGRSKFWSPAVLGDEKEQTLILAGDIFYGVDSTSWAKDLCERFKNVVMVLGNHDYWHQGRNIDDVNRFYRQVMTDTKNFHLLHNDFIELEGVIIYGGTCWTNCNNNPLVEIQAPHFMRPDFELIHQMSPNEWVKHHGLFVSGLQRMLKMAPEKVIVVSHHAPSFNSIAEHYRGNFPMNYFYFSDLDYFMEYEENIGYWCHGHTHNSMDYMINKTRVLCNPRGYDDENREICHTVYEY